MTLALLLLLGPGTPAQTPGIEQQRYLEVAGSRRSFLLYLPTTYRAGRPVPLVLVFHAAGGRGRGIARHTGFTELAEREGFAVAYPDGIGGRWNDGRRPSARDDVGFVRALVDSLRREVTVDSSRIYATGISNGAMLSYRLACDLPGVFAAIAPVAGALPVNLSERCAPATPLSVASFQGTADPSLPYDGGGTPPAAVLSAERSVAFWAGAAGCATGRPATVVSDTVADGTRLRRLSYPDCLGHRDVVLYTIEGGGHTWPGGPEASRRVGRVSREVSATRVIWDFFQHHPGS
jgi:polyhydroxybutyrate depolymerase